MSPTKIDLSPTKKLEITPPKLVTKAPVSNNEIKKEAPKKVQHSFMFINLIDDALSDTSSSLINEDVSSYFKDGAMKIKAEEDKIYAPMSTMFNGLFEAKMKELSPKKPTEFSSGKPLYFYTYQQLPADVCVNYMKVHEKCSFQCSTGRWTCTISLKHFIITFLDVGYMTRSLIKSIS